MAKILHWPLPLNNHSKSKVPKANIFLVGKRRALPPNLEVSNETTTGRGRGRWRDKETQVRTHSGTWLGSKKQWNHAICCYMDVSKVSQKEGAWHRMISLRCGDRKKHGVGGGGRDNKCPKATQTIRTVPSRKLTGRGRARWWKGVDTPMEEWDWEVLYMTPKQ